MRLTEYQAQAIKDAVESVIGIGARVWLFGSRVDDTRRGGDIDLLVEIDHLIPDRMARLCRLEATLIRKLGDRKLDVLLKDSKTPPAPIHDIAVRTGILL